jgi:hypothetical protein
VKKETANPKEKVQVLGLAPDGNLLVAQQCGHVAKLRPAREGQPIPPNHDLGTLTVTPDGECTMEIVYRHEGPARVSTNAYRRGWDATFGPN